MPPKDLDRGDEFLGKRLREIRASRMATLETIAQKSGLTRGHISKIERGQVSCSMSALLRICDALNVGISELLDPPSVRLVRLAERQRTPFGGEGLQEYLLTPTGESRIQVLITEVMPHGGSGTDPYELPVDVEFLHILDGELDITLGSETLRLYAGDSLTFTSGLHTFHNPADEVTKVLWVLSPAMTRPDPTHGMIGPPTGAAPDAADGQSRWEA